MKLENAFIPRTRIAVLWATVALVLVYAALGGVYVDRRNTFATTRETRSGPKNFDLEINLGNNVRRWGFPCLVSGETVGPPHRLVVKVVAAPEAEVKEVRITSIAVTGQDSSSNPLFSRTDSLTFVDSSAIPKGINTASTNGQAPLERVADVMLGQYSFEGPYFDASHHSVLNLECTAIVVFQDGSTSRATHMVTKQRTTFTRVVPYVYEVLRTIGV